MTISRTGAGSTIDVTRTRPALRAIEPVFAAGVLCPGVHEALNDLGLGIRGAGAVNIVTRAAPLGAASAELVLATFYNINPAYVATVVPAAWKKASPERILAAYEAGYGPALAAALAPLDPAEVHELAELSRTAGLAASANHEGRALFAGFASLPWPQDDHLVIWHAAKLLREHRGDGHIGTLVTEGLRGIDALVVHAPFEGYPPEALRDSRRWDAKSWDIAVGDLRRRGWLTDAEAPTLTEEGRERRQWMEDRTDDLAAVAYEPLGPAGMDRMIELGGKVVAALNAAGLTLRPRSLEDI